MVSGRIKKQIPKTNKLIFPRIGSICVGLKNDKGLPQSVDYFIARGKYAGLFHKVYGDRPQTIQIIFPDDEAQNGHSAYSQDEACYNLWQISATIFVYKDCFTSAKEKMAH